MIRIVLVTAFLGSVLPTSASAQNLVANGSFELNPLSPGSYRDLLVGSHGLPGWTIVGVPGTYVSQVDSAFGGNPGYSFPAKDGTSWLDLAGFTDNAPNGVQQTIATTIGQRYTFSFWLGNVTGPFFGTQSAVGVAFSSGGTGFSCTNLAGTTTLTWQPCSQTFVATNSTTTFAISNLDPRSDYSNAIDQVSLVAVTPAVAEPPGWALMVAGVALARAALRRRAGRGRIDGRGPKAVGS
jgi:hypothetical protein